MNQRATKRTKPDPIHDLRQQVDVLVMRLDQAQSVPVPQAGPRLNGRILIVNDQICSLSKTEARLVGLLLKHPGRIVYCHQVNSDWSDGPGSLRKAVSKLKRKLVDASLFDVASAITSEDGGYYLSQFFATFCDI